jgi:hypothetical protein
MLSSAIIEETNLLEIYVSSTELVQKICYQRKFSSVSPPHVSLKDVKELGRSVIPSPFH